MLKPTNESTGAVVCAVVDGPISENGPLARIVASRNVVAPPCADTGPVVPPHHAAMCAETIDAFSPGALIRLVQVFARDGDDAPAEQVLEGLEIAARSDAKVLCLPWTIAETRLRDRFEDVCAAASNSGKILVAAWARDVSSPVPASFASVIGVIGLARRDGPRRSFEWNEELGAASTPFGASRGTAIVSALAAIYAGRFRSAGRDDFAATLKRFAGSSVPQVDVSAGRADWMTYSSASFVACVGKAYSEFLDCVTGDASRDGDCAPDAEGETP